MANDLEKTAAKYGFADRKLCFQTSQLFVSYFEFAFAFFVLENVVVQSKSKTWLFWKKNSLRSPFFNLFVNKSVSYLEEHQCFTVFFLVRSFVNLTRHCTYTVHSLLKETTLFRTSSQVHTMKITTIAKI